MRLRGERITCALLALGLNALPVFAVGADGNPYSAIINRNAFDLRAPDPPPAEVPAVLPSNIRLTGIATILGNPRAFLMVQEGPGKPERSCILSEKERDGGVEVLAINQRDGSVTVNNAGTVATLTFEKDGIKPGPAPPPRMANVPVPARVAAPPPASAAPAAQPVPEPQVQEVMIEVNRQRYLDSGDPRARILPPTSLTPLRDEGN